LSIRSIVSIMASFLDAKTSYAASRAVRNYLDAKNETTVAGTSVFTRSRLRRKVSIS
jgi:hypothetical protein